MLYRTDNNFFTQQFIKYTKCWRSRKRAHGNVIAYNRHFKDVKDNRNNDSF